MPGLQTTPKTLLLLKIKISKQRDKQRGFTIGFFKPGAKHQDQQDSLETARRAIKHIPALLTEEPVAGQAGP